MAVSYKWLLAGIGGVIGYFAPTAWLMLICILVVIFDSYSAYQLSVRVKKSFPNLAEGKFKSNAGLKAIRKIRDICLVILLAYMIEDKVIIMFDLYLPYVAAGAFIFVETWSILENKSSCNGNKWARVLQKVMIDKTARHFDIDPSLINSIIDEKGTTNTGNSHPVNIVQDTKAN